MTMRLIAKNDQKGSTIYGYFGTPYPTTDQAIEMCGLTIGEDGEAIDQEGNGTGYWYDEFDLVPYYGEYTDEAADMLDRFQWDLIESYMDAEIAEQLNTELAPCSDMEFLAAYMKAHAAKFDSDFEIN